MQVVGLHMGLLLSPAGLMEASIVSRSDNPIHALARHLGSSFNSCVMPALKQQAQGRGRPWQRLLQLVSPGLFEPARYRLQGVLARGGASVVRGPP